jgi:hypothetical protein
VAEVIAGCVEGVLELPTVKDQFLIVMSSMNPKVPTGQVQLLVELPAELLDSGSIEAT